MNRRVAWVMVNHNGGGEVVASLRSLLADLGPADRVYLVDNGSSDGSAPQAAALDRDRVELIEHRDNKPFAEATNIGLRRAIEAGFRFAGPINPDVRVRPGMVDALVERLDLDGAREGELAAVSPAILYDDPDDRLWYGGGRILWPISWMQHLHRRAPLSKLERAEWETQFVTGCCWLSPAQVWRDHGMLDPAYGMYAEDIDWSTRVWRAEQRLLVLRGAVLVHHVSMTTGGGRTPFKMTWRTLASRLFFQRWTPPCLRAIRALLTPPFVAFYASFLYLVEGPAPAVAYLRAWRSKLRDPVPWPPSRHLIDRP